MGFRGLSKCNVHSLRSTSSVTPGDLFDGLLTASLVPYMLLLGEVRLPTSLLENVLLTELFWIGQIPSC